MKTTLTIILIIFSSIIGYSQTKTDMLKKYQSTNYYSKLKIDSLKNIKEPFPIVNWGTSFDPWEDTCYFNNNCSMWGYNKIGPFNQPGNLWQTGRPLKPNPLDTTFTPPNVLITDTINPYPVSNNSSFELHFGRWPGYESLCWSWMLFGFRYRIDADSARDGIYVEIMYNGSNQWKNIIYDDMADSMYLDYWNTYFPTDTLCNGESGISYQNPLTMDQGWSFFSMEWIWNNAHAHIADSVAFRITFVSDSINTNKGGVLIDYVGIVVEDRCSIGVNEIYLNNNAKLFPNPVNNKSIIEMTEVADYLFSIYDMLGNIVFRKQYYSRIIPLNEITLKAGIYNYTVASNKNCFNGKFIVEP